MNASPDMVCFRGRYEKCMSREEATELFLEVLDDLELLGLVRREGSRIVYDVSRIGTMIWPCFQTLRKLYEDIGLLEEFRRNAQKDPWFWACSAVSYCVAFALGKKRLDYGLDVSRALEYTDEYLIALHMTLCSVIERLFNKDEVTKMFKATFEI